MILAVINQKGGTGKTCTSVHLAYWLAVHQKKSVQLIDADAQTSSSVWVNSLPVDIPSFAITDPDQLAEQIPLLAKDTEFTVIDGAGGISELTRVILYYANIALVPCQPTALDLHSSSSAVRLIRQAQGFRKDELKAATFLSRAVPNTRLVDEVTTVLGKIEGLTLLKTIIHQRQVVADAFGQQSVVWTMGANAKKAAHEYSALFQETIKL
jgi:chromosome partitioning protein